MLSNGSSCSGSSGTGSGRFSGRGNGSGDWRRCRMRRMRDRQDARLTGASVCWIVSDCCLSKDFDRSEVEFSEQKSRF